ncbi:MAG TPA: FAD-dependent oxidoreductase [Amycolatopsis sp.]|nr:FAD-dependent oxidoreductase [Amycolatopsis sp.]
MTASGRLVIVGASVASGALIGQLRADGFAGRVLVVDRDPDAPYDRPPLSKEFLSGTAVRPEAPWWDDRCELIRGRATALDVASSTVRVELAEGTTCDLGADHIVIASGSVPVRLPGEPAGVAHLRTAADARRIRESVSPGRRVIILGAGTIGTELASSLVDAGCAATIVDLADRPLDRFLGGHLGDASADWIRRAGVDLRLGTRVEDIAREGGSWLASTSSGPVSGDLVVSAIGTRPATEWLAGSGLDVADGVRCDSDGTAVDTSGRPVPTVHAIGDVSAWNTVDNERQSFQDWTTARRQGRHLARHLLGLHPAQPAGHEPHYFWSHQFGRRIQVLGIPHRDAILVQHVDEPARRAAFYRLERDSETVAWIAVNTPREFAKAMRMSIGAVG